MNSDLISRAENSVRNQILSKGAMQSADGMQMRSVFCRKGMMESQPCENNGKYSNTPLLFRRDYGTMCPGNS